MGLISSSIVVALSHSSPKNVIILVPFFFFVFAKKSFAVVLISQNTLSKALQGHSGVFVWCLRICVVCVCVGVCLCGVCVCVASLKEGIRLDTIMFLLP